MPVAPKTTTLIPATLRGTGPLRRFKLLALELVVILGVLVLAGNAAAARWRVAAPVLLLAAGVGLGFVPALREVTLPPEAVLLLFLPALLYWESLTTSLREIRSNFRVIVLMSTALVVATAGAVAWIAHGFGLPWGPAWVLGAAVAPTDATVVGVLARGLPRRALTVLRAESLINDGTALVIYGLAVGATVAGGSLGPWRVSGMFVLAYAGGAAAGLITAWLAVQVRRRLDEPLHENVVSVLTPFTAYLIAESVHASGVVAVVIGGLTLSQIGPRIISAHTRTQAEAFWRLATFLLNGALFVLVGIAAAGSVRELHTVGVGGAILAVGLVSLTVIAVRFAWLFTTPYVIRALDRRPQQRLRRVGARQRLVSGVTGFRGAVSLAAALAVPITVASGEPFPYRDLIVFVTSGVIIVTLVTQGLLLPIAVRWARFPEDVQVVEERHLAETTATREALDALADVAAELGTHPEVVERTRSDYEEHLAVLEGSGHTHDPDDVEHGQQVVADHAALRLALLARKRMTVVRLRDQGHIDDTVLRLIQAQMDVEEIRLARREAVD